MRRGSIFVEFAAEHDHGYGLIVSFRREVFGPLAAVADANGVALVRAEDAIVESFALAKSLSVAGEGQSRDQHGGIAGQRLSGDSRGIRFADAEAAEGGCVNDVVFVGECVPRQRAWPADSGQPQRTFLRPPKTMEFR